MMVNEPYHIRYYRENTEKCKKKANSSYKKIRKTLKSILGTNCANCGFSDIRILHVDHKNGGGLKEIRAFKTNYNMYKFYSENPEIAKEKLQLLCPNCNWLKRINNNENRK